MVRTVAVPAAVQSKAVRRSTMKHGIALLLSTLWLTALLSGCGQAPASTSEASEPASTPESTVVEATPTPEPAAPTPDPTEEPPAEYVPGERTDTSYTNTVLGLQFTLPTDMVMASDDEINQMMQASVDMMYEDPETGEMVIDYTQLTTVYEMVAVNISDGSNIIVMSEKLPLSGMTEEQYITAMEQQMAQTTMTIDFGEPGTTTVGGIDFTSLDYTVEANGTQTMQSMLLKKVGDRMYALTLSYYAPESRDTLLSCFSALTAV